MKQSSGKENAGADKVFVGKEGSPRKSDIRLVLRRPLVHILLIALLGFIAYSNTFHNSFHWDGLPQIAHNPVIKNLGNFISSEKGYDFNPRRFIGYLTFALNYYVGGPSVTGYHIVNLAIHVINGILVYFLVVLTFMTTYFRGHSAKGIAHGAADKHQATPQSAEGDTPPSSPRKLKHNPPLSPLKLRGEEGGVLFKIQDSRYLIALFAALLFVAHPLQTEAVTYIVQRLTSLAAMFYLLSIVMYAKARLSSRPAGKLACFFFSLLFAVLAMKTKEIAFTLPIIIVLYEFFFFKSTLKKKLLILLPVILTIVIIPISVLGTHKPLGELLSDLSASTRVETNIPRWNYLMTQLKVITTYIRLLFFPANQNLDYDYPIYHSLFTPAVFLSFLFLSAILGLGVYLLYKSKGHSAKGIAQQAGKIASRQADKPASPQAISSKQQAASKSPASDLEPLTSNLEPVTSYYRLIAFGIFWFFMTLSVTSSIIPIADVIFEHRLYLPSVGFFIATTSGAFILADKMKKEKSLIAFLVLILLALSGITYVRNTAWKNETSLWTDVVLKSSGKARPHNNLAYLYMQDGKLDEAHKELVTALKLKPDYVEAHTTLGNVYFMQGRKADALRELQAALKIAPNYTEAHIDLGNIYSAEGRLDEAVREYEAVLKINPDHVSALISLGNCYLMQDQRLDAFRKYQAALRLSPDNFSAHNDLGNLYLMEGRTDDAIREYKIALKLNPNAVQTSRNLMTVYRQRDSQGKTAPSQDVSRIYPDSGVAYNNLGNVYYKQGKLEEALKQYESALKLLPDSAEVHNNIGKIYGRQGHLDKALREFRIAVRLNPGFADAHDMIGNVYGLQGNLAGAIKEYDIALKLAPGSADAHNNLGTIYFRQGRLDKALKEFQAALRLKPDDPGARRNLQILYKKKGIKPREGMAGKVGE